MRAGHAIQAAIVCLLAAPASAQTVKPFVDCAALANDAERLECYDSAVAAISPALRAQAEERRKQAAARAAEAAAAAQAAREAEERDRFGREGVRAFRGSDLGVESVESTVTEVLRDNLGKVVVILENGQMWRQVDGNAMPMIRTGTAVTIKRGAMGSYRMTPEKTSRTVQVMRMR